MAKPGLEVRTPPNSQAADLYHELRKVEKNGGLSKIYQGPDVG